MTNERRVSSVVPTIVLCLCLIAPAFGTDYFVSPQGDDATGEGSLAKPFATIKQGLAKAQPGDPLHRHPSAKLLHHLLAVAADDRGDVRKLSQPPIRTLRCVPPADNR